MFTRVGRWFFVAGALSLATLAWVSGLPTRQVWEKPIAPGLTYRMEWDASNARILNALRFSLKAPGVHAEPELGGSTVYREDVTKGRATVSSIVGRCGGIAGVNADFFPFTGHPLGLTVKGGQIISLPRPGRSIFGWGPDRAQFGVAKYTGSVSILDMAQSNSDKKLTESINGLNEDCAIDSLVLNTPTAGFAKASGTPSLCAVFKADSQSIPPSTVLTATFEYFLPDTTSTPVSKDDYILMARGNKIPFLSSLRQGQKISIRIQVEGFDWERIENTVGGGPSLVKDGKVSVSESERFDLSSFVNAKHPRTAVGKTATGDIWLVCIDGRSESASGVSLPDMAEQMVRLGCVEAINLDGGGSTTMNVLGLTVNRPSDGSERPVADAIVVYGPHPGLSDLKLHLTLRQTVRLGSLATAVVDDDNQKPVPNGEIVWASSGTAWIDQGGTIHPLKVGKARIQAAARGRVLSTMVQVAADPAATQK